MAIRGMVSKARKVGIAASMAILALGGGMRMLPNSAVRELEATPLSYIVKDSVPSLSDVESVAEYVDRHISSVESFKDNGGNLIFYFPDIHTTSVHESHKRKLEELHKVFGLSKVAVEGFANIHTSEQLDSEFRLTLEMQEKDPGFFMQLERNAARFEKREPRQIKTLDDYLAVSPLFSLTDKQPVSIVPTEKSNRQLYVGLMERVLEFYPELYRIEKIFAKKSLGLKQKEDFIREDEKRFAAWDPSDKKSLDYVMLPESIADRKKQVNELREGYAKIRQDFQPRIDKITQKLDRVMGHLDPSWEFPSYVGGIGEALFCQDMPFYKEVERLKKFTLIDQRSIDAVELSQKYVSDGMMGLVYGQAHTDQITDECDKRGISYIVLKIK